MIGRVKENDDGVYESDLFRFHNSLLGFTSVISGLARENHSYWIVQTDLDYELLIYFNPASEDYEVSRHTPSSGFMNLKRLATDGTNLVIWGSFMQYLNANYLYFTFSFLTFAGQTNDYSVNAGLPNEDFAFGQISLSDIGDNNLQLAICFNVYNLLLIEVIIVNVETIRNWRFNFY